MKTKKTDAFSHVGSIYSSPLGDIRLVADAEALTGLWFIGQKYEGGTVDLEAVRYESNAVLLQARRWLDAYFAGENPSLDGLPLHLQGSLFRKTVWKLLCSIPYGEVRTYQSLALAAAKLLGKERMAAQAVGNAIGHNPISIIIPCHRVVGTKGFLTGYAGGLEKKKWLLAHEGVTIDGSDKIRLQR